VVWVDCRGKGYVNGLCHVNPPHAHSSDAGNEKKNIAEYVIISFLAVIVYLLAQATRKAIAVYKYVE
jgi:hypothetical protein